MLPVEVPPVDVLPDAPDGAPPGRPPARAPSAPPADDGPAVGIEPFCAVVTASIEYAAGPASATPIASAATARCSTGPAAPATVSPTVATRPPTSTIQRSAGTNVGVSLSSTNETAVVSSTVQASTTEPTRVSRRGQT